MKIIFKRKTLITFTLIFTLSFTLFAQETQSEQSAYQSYEEYLANTSEPGLLNTLPAQIFLSLIGASVMSGLVAAPEPTMASKVAGAAATFVWIADAIGRVVSGADAGWFGLDDFIMWVNFEFIKPGGKFSKAINSLAYKVENEQIDETELIAEFGKIALDHPGEMKDLLLKAKNRVAGEASIEFNSGQLDHSRGTHEELLPPSISIGEWNSVEA